MQQVAAVIEKGNAEDGSCSAETVLLGKINLVAALLSHAGL